MYNPTFVDHHVTPLTFDMAAECFRSALRSQLGKDPTRETLALALAKSALECGRWKYCRNWNLGNIRPKASGGGMYTCFPICNELEGGKVVWYAPTGVVRSNTDLTVIREPWAAPPAVGKDGGVGHPGSRFAAYANHFDGAYSYVDFVSGGRYAAAWQLLLAGDAAGYVHALKLRGYFTADETEYRKSVVSIQKEFIGRLAGQNPETHEPEDHEWEAIRAAIVGSSWQRAQDDIGTAADNQRAFDADDELPPGAA
jgi:hypothetical protein